MNYFKKASEIKKDPKENHFLPEIKDVIICHIENSEYPVTVTSTLIALNKRSLNPSRNIIRRYLDKLAESGFVIVNLNGNVYEYKPSKKDKSDCIFKKIKRTKNFKKSHKKI